MHIPKAIAGFPAHKKGRDIIIESTDKTLLQIIVQQTRAGINSAAIAIYITPTAIAAGMALSPAEKRVHRQQSYIRRKRNRLLKICPSAPELQLNEAFVFSVNYYRFRLSSSRSDKLNRASVNARKAVVNSETTEQHIIPDTEYWACYIDGKVRLAETYDDGRRPKIIGVLTVTPGHETNCVLLNILRLGGCQPPFCFPNATKDAGRYGVRKFKLEERILLNSTNGKESLELCVVEEYAQKIRHEKPLLQHYNTKAPNRAYEPAF